jgi:hypothetical protein
MPNNSKSPPLHRRYVRGDRCLLRGLQNKPDLNGCLVEILTVIPDQQRYKAKVLRAPTRFSSSTETYENVGKILAVKELNLLQCELKWKRIETASNADEFDCLSMGGSVAYSDTAMYVFGGIRQVDLDVDEDEDDDESDLWSFNFKQRKWRCHWWKGLPGPVEGLYGSFLRQLGWAEDVDYSRSPPLRSQGALLVYTDPSTKEDVLFFYSSKQADPPPRESEPAIDPDHVKTDCLWIWRSFSAAFIPFANKDLGYWQTIATTGRKPASFLTGSLLEHTHSDRRCTRATVLVPCENGVRMLFWGGYYWTPFDTEGMTNPDVMAAARTDVAMSGLFELHIPLVCLKRSKNRGVAACETPERPRWSLLEQKGSELPLARYIHSVSLCGRDLVVMGGECINGLPRQRPEDAGCLVKQLGDFAYNLDTCEWRRLKFATEFSKTPFVNNILAQCCEDDALYLQSECISNQVAFPLPNGDFQSKMMQDYREQIYTAAVSCSTFGLLPGGMPNVWREVWSYLVPPGRGRLLVVRQYDGIYEAASAVEECDNAVMVFDMMDEKVTPLFTFSNVQNDRIKDPNKKQLGSHLSGIAENWINGAVYPLNDGSTASVRLLLHGKLTDDPARERYSVNEKDMSVFSAPIH